MSMRSVSAVLAGFVMIAVLSIGADALMRQMVPTAFGPAGQMESPPLLVFTLLYVGIIAVSGCYLTARLAPDRPMLHALVLGGLGLLVNIGGMIALWETAPAWYHVTAVALVMPYAWAGGRLREVELTRPHPAV